MSIDSLSNVVESNPTTEVEIASQICGTDTSLLRHLLKPSYRLRTLKNRGAILILVWNYAAWTAFSYSTNKFSMNGTVKNELLFVLVQAIGAGVLMPLAGWLADIRFGRYRVITLSVWMMWISSVLSAVGSVVAQLFEPYQHIDSKVSLAMLLLMGIGFCGFQANLVQFGVDQLHDASTIEITSFIAWYTGTYLSGRFTLYFVLTCLHDKYALLGPLVVNFHLTIIVVTHSLFNNIWIKEPVTQNPFKLVYNVIKYAIKNKYPRQRSAFTYCEDVIPSRIDFGKHKYGGPFTTEQVEDVKVLFWSLIIALVIASFYGTTYNETTLDSQTKAVLQLENSKVESLQTCFSKYIHFNGIYFLTSMVLIPINEFFVYPIFQRCIPYFKIYSKFIAGAIFRITKYITLIGLIMYARYHYIKENTEVTYHPNVTVTCLFQANSGSLRNSLDERWFILPQILSSLSDMLIVTSMIEYFCAQVPYSMKGIIAGITYALLGQFMALGNLILLPFRLISSWSEGTISCGFWYLLTKLLFLLVVAAMITVVGCRYRQRKREDVLPNEQIFAERYYSKKILESTVRHTS